MGKKNDVPLKEKYRLWWEYLKRSEKYKVFSNSPIKKAEKSEWLQLMALNGVWGNIHKEPFEKWWNFRQEEIKAIRGGISLLNKEDLKTHLEVALACIPKKKSSPTIKEFIDFAAKFLIKSNKKIFLLEGFLGFRKVGVDTFIKDFEGIIKKIIADDKLFARSKKSDGNAKGINLSLLLTQPLRFDEVKRFLAVYDRVKKLQSEKKTWDQIFDEFHPDITKKLLDETLSRPEYEKQLRRKESCLRILKRDCAYANKIIKNVERSIFPGKYN
jgi:hypothetical protein